MPCRACHGSSNNNTTPCNNNTTTHCCCCACREPNCSSTPGGPAAAGQARQTEVHPGSAHPPRALPYRQHWCPAPQFAFLRFPRLPHAVPHAPCSHHHSSGPDPQHPPGRGLATFNNRPRHHHTRRHMAGTCVGGVHHGVVGTTQQGHPAQACRLPGPPGMAGPTALAHQPQPAAAHLASKEAPYTQRASCQGCHRVHTY